MSFVRFQGQLSRFNHWMLFWKACTRPVMQKVACRIKPQKRLSASGDAIMESNQEEAKFTECVTVLDL